jgi:arylsulfatase
MRMTLIRRPDLVLIMTDQQRYDQIGYVGTTPVRTPNLDRLAAAGVIFDTTYSASTTCIPARTSLMTGLLDHRAPYLEPFVLDPGFFTVPHALRAAGYETALIGKMHFTPMRSPHGFEHMRVVEHFGAYNVDPTTLPELDHYHDWLRAQGLPDWRLDGREDNCPYPLDPATHPTSWVEREATAFLRDRDGDRPLFLVVSFPHPHPPVNPPASHAGLYDPDECVIDPEWHTANAYLPASFRRATAQADAPHRRIQPERMRAHRATLAHTYGLITQIDEAVGRIVAHLDLDATVLFFTSDHGDYAGHRGLVRKVPWIPFDDLARVPFFVTGAGVAGGRRDAGLAQSFDFATTCLDYAGVDVDLAAFDGISLAPLLGDPAASLDADRTVHCGISMRWPMVRRGPHKYLRSGWGEEVLFDVERDPGEVYNLTSLDPDREIRGVLAEASAQRVAATTPDLPRFDVAARR